MSCAGRRSQATYHIAQCEELRIVVVDVGMGGDVSIVLPVDDGHDCGGRGRRHRNEFQKLTVKYLCGPHER